MSATAAPRKPRTARQQRAEDGVLDVRIVAYPEPASEASGGGGTAGGDGQPPPVPRRRTGGGREPAPAWERLALMGALLLTLGVLLGVIGSALKPSQEASS